MGNDSGLKMDHEWVKLILEAKKLGIAKEEIRAFLRRYEASQAGNIKKETAVR